MRATTGVAATVAPEQIGQHVPKQTHAYPRGERGSGDLGLPKASLEVIVKEAARPAVARESERPDAV